MQLNKACLGVLTLLFLLIVKDFSSAETMVINYTDRGWYTPEGLHRPVNTNYLVGDNRGGGCTTSETCKDDFRNFFVFDLSGVTKAVGPATFALWLPLPSGYQSADTSENYELHDVVTPIATLVAGTGGVAAHADLGSGVVYGSRTMTDRDMGQEVGQMEQRLGVKFHPDYRKLLLKAGNVNYGTVEPASITRPGYPYLPDICDEAWSVAEVPQHLLPFCENNGDYYCIDSSGKIVYWDHNGSTDEIWRDLATWIEEVWIGEEAA
jgi:hypothetical protein